MKTPKANLYRAFGKLVYAIAMADGKIQQEEIEKLHAVISEHHWAKNVIQSFDQLQNSNKKQSLNEILQEAIEIFEDYGSCYEYPIFIDFLEQIAASFGGIVLQEEELISFLKEELLENLNEELDYSLSNSR